MPRRDELVRTALAHAEQHLELVVLSSHPRDALEPALDQPLVVRRDPHVRPHAEQLVERLDEVRPHRVEVRERDLRRLDVDPLAEPDVRAEIRERREISRAAVTIPDFMQYAIKASHGATKTHHRSAAGNRSSPSPLPKGRGLG